MKSLRLAIAAVVLASGSLLHTTAASANELSAKTAVLVHGAFADGTSWHKVIPLLQQAGLNVIAVQNPLHSLQEDVDYTKRAIESAKGPVVLVGHSWGGMVITEAGIGEKVKSLVYVAAFAPSKGESLHDTLAGYEAPVGLANPIVDAEGFLTLSANTVAKHFAQDLTAEETSIMAVTQGALQSKALDEKVTQAAWENKPSWFVIPENDHMAQPALQHAFAKKIDAKVTSLQSSHVPMLSNPAAVAKVIIEAAKAK